MRGTMLQLGESQEERRRIEHTLSILEAADAAQRVLLRQQSVEEQLSKVTSVPSSTMPKPRLFQAP